MTTLADRDCRPSRPGTPPLDPFAIDPLLAQLSGRWKVVGTDRLEAELTFPDFAEALEFVNIVGAIAEQQNHHPDIHLSWGRVRIVLWTHTVGGLSEADFVLAARCDRAFEEGSEG